MIEVKQSNVVKFGEMELWTVYKPVELGGGLLRVKVADSFHVYLGTDDFRWSAFPNELCHPIAHLTVNAESWTDAVLPISDDWELVVEEPEGACILCGYPEPVTKYGELVSGDVFDWGEKDGTPHDHLKVAGGRICLNNLKWYEDVYPQDAVHHLAHISTRKRGEDVNDFVELLEKPSRETKKHSIQFGKSEVSDEE